jgi:hypothetical protein
MTIFEPSLHRRWKLKYYLVDIVSWGHRAGLGCQDICAINLPDFYYARLNAQQRCKATSHFTDQILRKAGFFRMRENNGVIIARMHSRLRTGQRPEIKHREEN